MWHLRFGGGDILVYFLQRGDQINPDTTFDHKIVTRREKNSDLRLKEVKIDFFAY